MTMANQNKYPDREDIEKVKEKAGCDTWIASKALTASGFCVKDAVNLVRERLSYQAQSCSACGEMLADKWTFCPYCGKQKFGGNDGTTYN